MIEIANWSQIYETAATRKRERLAWIQIPTGVDSPEMVALVGGAWHESGMRLADGRQVDGMPVAERQALGVMALGVFFAMVAHQATCRKSLRGRFVRDDGSPMSPAMIAAVLRLPLQLLENAIVTLSAPGVGWLKVPNVCQSPAADLPLFCQSPADKEKEKEKEKEVLSSSARALGAWQAGGRPSAGHRQADGETSAEGWHLPELPAELLEMVEAIRCAYPKHTRPLDAQAAILGRIRAGADPEAMLAGTDAIARLVEAEWTEADRLRRLPGPPEFFGGDRWREDPSEWRDAKRVEAEAADSRRSDWGSLSTQDRDENGRGAA